MTYYIYRKKRGPLLVCSGNRKRKIHYNQWIYFWNITSNHEMRLCLLGVVFVALDNRLRCQGTNNVLLNCFSLSSRACVYFIIYCRISNLLGMTDGSTMLILHFSLLMSHIIYHIEVSSIVYNLISSWVFVN